MQVMSPGGSLGLACQSDVCSLCNHLLPNAGVNEHHFIVNSVLSNSDRTQLSWLCICSTVSVVSAGETSRGRGGFTRKSWDLESSGGFFTHTSGARAGQTQRLGSAGGEDGHSNIGLLHVAWASQL